MEQNYFESGTKNAEQIADHGNARILIKERCRLTVCDHADCLLALRAGNLIPAYIARVREILIYQSFVNS